MEKESVLNDGFAALETIAAAFATPTTGVPVISVPAAVVPVVVAAPEIAGDVDLPAPADEAAAPKLDRRKGERKVQNADGTVSYGLKADGTPRAKPGRKAKPAAV